MKSYPRLNLSPRRCLRCGNEFLSQGPGNRICRRCSARVLGNYRVEGGRCGRCYKKSTDLMQ